MTEPASLKPKKKSSCLKWFLWLMLVGILLTGSVAGYGWHRFHAPGPSIKQTTVILKKGLGVDGIIEQLYYVGLIKVTIDPQIFKAAAYITGKGRHFKAGEYRFDAGISQKELMDKLVEGKVVIHDITIPEGYTTREILDIVKKNEVLSGEIPVDIAEGTLLPETYHFTYGDTRADVIERMKKAMVDVLSKAWMTRKDGLPLATMQEALILASIVEKETGIAHERPRVAAVFINRLKMGMKLQSDPTILYTIQQERPEQTTIYASDLKKETPYNTYVIDGLPPTPIANPGKASIQAVLNPPDTKDLYFVATGNGGHRFAQTLQEHNKNVRDYRKALKQVE